MAKQNSKYVMNDPVSKTVRKVLEDAEGALGKSIYDALPQHKEFLDKIGYEATRPRPSLAEQGVKAVKSAAKKIPAVIKRVQDNAKMVPVPTLPMLKGVQAKATPKKGSVESRLRKFA